MKILFPLVMTDNGFRQRLFIKADDYFTSSFYQSYSANSYLQELRECVSDASISCKFDAAWRPQFQCNETAQDIPSQELERRMRRGEIVPFGSIPSDDSRVIRDSEFIERMEFGEKLMSEGREHFFNSRFLEANTVFTQGVNLLRGLEAQQEERTCSLIKKYESFVKNKALCCLKLGHYNEGVQACRDFARYNPTFQRLTYYEALLQSELGNLNEACSLLKNLSENNSIDPVTQSSARFKYAELLRKSVRTEHELSKIYDVLQCKYESFDILPETKLVNVTTTKKATKVKKSSYKSRDEERFTALGTLVALEIMRFVVLHCAERRKEFEMIHIANDYKEIPIIKKTESLLLEIYEALRVGPFAEHFADFTSAQQVKVFFDSLILYCIHGSSDSALNKASLKFRSAIRNIVLGSAVV